MRFGFCCVSLIFLCAFAGGLSGERAIPLQSGPKWERELKLRAEEKKADDLPRVRLQTSQGDMVLELFENQAPGAVANFIHLVENGFYDGLAFHRVITDFMAQGGCPNSKSNPARAGTGGPGWRIACECYRADARHHFPGTLSMAHAGRDTGGSQFFITFRATEHLDGRHTAFGRVADGMDVLKKLEGNAGKRPWDTIKKATVVRKRNHKYEPKKLPDRR